LLPVCFARVNLINTLTDTSRAIAWSKWGSIASITPDGAVLEFRNLRCSPEDGNWALSEPTKTPPLTSNLDGGPLKHICWSPTGSELAVIDAAGRVTILSIFSSLNKPTLSRHCQGDPADDLHGVVGCYWLNAPYPANRPVCLSKFPNMEQLLTYFVDNFKWPRCQRGK
jgi:mediator of RNA polymerase II transcription subunit 16